MNGLTAAFVLGASLLMMTVALAIGGMFALYIARAVTSRGWRR